MGSQLAILVAALFVLAACGSDSDPGGTAPSWTAYDEAADNHLELALTITEKAGLLDDECDFWDRQ